MQVYAKLQLLTENKLEWKCSYSLRLKLLQKPNKFSVYWQSIF